MTTLKRVAVFAGAATLALPLVACSSDDGGDYCALVEGAESDFGDLDLNANPERFDEVADTVQEIADAAPDDIKSDWQTFADALTTMRDIDTSDPEVVMELQEDDEFAQMMTDVDAANQNIEANVEEECDVTFTP